MKGLVQIITNIGNFNICVHTDLVPKTSENFI
jgi:cyclophilin family peptidyl-prolyl cis-trans isomerase